VCSILVAVAIAWEPAFTARAVLIGALLILTTPVASHEIARAAAKEHGLRSGVQDPGLD
jgi:multisubunit Na+/H+ antiporter MnhG subunit